MKRLVILLTLVSSIILPTLVFAQGYKTETDLQTQAFAGTRGADYGTPRDPRLVVAYTIQILLSTVGILFLAYTVYAGYLILMARGDEAEVTKGKETLKTAIIGMVIIFSSYSITLFVARVALSSSGQCYRTSLFDLVQLQPAFREVSCTEQDQINSQEEEGVEIKEDSEKFIKESPLR